MARAKPKSPAQPFPSASETTFAPRPTSDVSAQRPRALVHEPLPAVDLNPPDLLTYQRDLLERSVLFFDTLRKRANNMLEHERAGLPPLLNFEHELLLDARQFDRPSNYALLRVTDVGDACWEDCVDLAKPPVIVIDPRAGHGPGIGGFKRESEVGIALHVGHPVYFVVFFPEPCPGQTLSDVLSALARFVDFVAERHEGRRPVLYGNCQAGWAATLLSVRCEAGTGT